MRTTIADIDAQVVSALADLVVATFGVADPVVVRDKDEDGNEIAIPVAIEPDGECHDVMYDDDNDVRIYHRVNKKDYTTITADGFGDDPRRVVAYDMAMVVCGKRSKIDVYELERLCCRAIEHAHVPNVGNVAGYAMPTQTNFHAIQVFTSEYSGVQFPYRPDVFLFKITYKINRAITNCA